MASSETPRLQCFQVVDGMQLQIKVLGSLNGRNARIELQLNNCTRAWILHWGCIFHGNSNWFIPADHFSGTSFYKPGALQTPFTKSGESYAAIIELRDPKLRGIEFVLKESSSNRWMKLNNGNFRVDIPEHDENTTHALIPKDLIDRKAYLIWESKGRPVSTPEQQKKDYDDAVRELQNQLTKGISLNDLQSSCISSSVKALTDTRRHSRWVPSSYCRRHDVDKWLHKHYVDHGRTSNINMPFSALIDLVERTAGGDKVMSRQSHHINNSEIVVLTKITKNDYHILVAMNAKSTGTLHWGVSRSSMGEWLAPPSDILPERSKLLAGACQIYFTEISTGKGSFQLVDINLRQRSFLGVQFVIWTGGSWIKNKGANFVVLVNSSNSRDKVDGMRNKLSNGYLMKYILEKKRPKGH